LEAWFFGRAAGIYHRRWCGLFGLLKVGQTLGEAEAFAQILISFAILKLYAERVRPSHCATFRFHFFSSFR
jgi:hypothetical protein